MLKIKKNKNPLVSIIIPCFNNAEYIGEAIESAISQDYSNIEIIVINDGSTDNSINIIKRFENIKLINQENLGACAARNVGLNASKGKYIKFLDADDLLEPQVISMQVNQSESLKKNTIVYGDYILLNGNTKKTYSTYIDKQEQTALLIVKDILISTPLHHKYMLVKIGGFDERLRNGQEWNLHVRLSSEGFIFHHYKVPIFTYRIHNSPERISVQKHEQNVSNRFEYETEKLDITLASLAESYTGDIKAALAYKHLAIAKGYFWAGDRIKSKEHYKICKNMTVDYKKYWTKNYRIKNKILGFNLAELYTYSIQKLKSYKRNKFV